MKDLWCTSSAELHCGHLTVRCETCPLSSDGERSQARWDAHFMRKALECASMSKDPSTKVGAVLVKDRHAFSDGFNGFPVGVADNERLFDREQKLEFVVHAEMNAILFAAKRGIATCGSTLYVAARDATGGAAWGGPPCVRCTVECIQAGVTEFVSWPMKVAPSRWHTSIMKAREVIKEAGLLYREVYFHEIFERVHQPDCPKSWGGESMPVCTCSS